MALGTQDKTTVTLQLEELEVMHIFLLAKRFEILPMIENNRVVGLTAHMEPFLMAIRKRGMVEDGVAASHNIVTVERKEKRKKPRRIKKERSIKLVEKAGIG